MTVDTEGWKPPTGWGGVERQDLVICTLAGLAVMLVVTHFADLGRGRAAGLCALVGVLVTRVRWMSRKKLGFWLAIGLASLAQIAVIALIPFPDLSIPAYGLFPVALLVYLFDEGILWVFGARS